jgi:hypothetical protein
MRTVFIEMKEGIRMTDNKNVELCEQEMANNTE